VEVALELLGGQQSALLQLGTDAYRGYVAGLAKFANFFASGDGTCSKTGCQALWRKVSKYGFDLAKGALTASSELSASLTGTLLASLAPEPFLECACGGTLDYTPMMQGFADALSENVGLLGFSPPSAPPGTSNASEASGTTEGSAIGTIATSFIDNEETVRTRPLQAGLLSSIFSPFFLCSSETCKAVTSQILGLVDSVHQSLGVNDTGKEALTFASISWCPADAATAGYFIEQEMVIGGTVEEFTPALQALFKKGVVAEINEAIGADSFLKITPAQVALSITPGSVNVGVGVTVSTPALSTGVSQGMGTIATMPANTLSSKFGVTVESAAAPKAPVTQAVSVSDPNNLPGGGGGGSGGGDGDGNLAVVIGVSAGGTIAMVGAILIYCYCRRRNPTKPAIGQVSSSKPAPPEALPMGTAVPTAKFCTKCGTKVSGHFCTTCGVPVDGTVAA